MKKTINKPLKNYVILIALFLIVIFIYSTFVKIYCVNKIANSSVLSNTIPIISLNDFDNYIVENPNSLIYMPTLEGDNNKFEQEFLELIISKHLEKQIVYLNIGSSNYSKIKSQMISSNNFSVDKNETAIILLFKEQKIIDKLEITKNYKLNDVENFIEKGNEVLDND